MKIQGQVDTSTSTHRFAWKAPETLALTQSGVQADYTGEKVSMKNKVKKAKQSNINKNKPHMAITRRAKKSD